MCCTRLHDNTLDMKPIGPTPACLLPAGSAADTSAGAGCDLILNTL